MPVNLVIKDNDIKVGKRKSLGYCPTSYCLKRVFGRNDVLVYRDYAFVGPHMIELPPHVSKFIEDFDRQLLVRCVEWQLPDPPTDLTFKSDSL
jgi:hypothetical protein